MRFLTPVLAGLLVGACGEAQPPGRGDPEQYSAEQIREALPGITDACIEALQSGDTSAPPTEKCFEMQKRQRWRGLWRNAFEGSRFCPQPARECGDDTPGEKIWLTFSGELPQSRLENFGGLYELEFVGRRTLKRGSYGHFGMSDHEVIVDRLVSMKEVEAPPPPPTKAEMIKSWKECEAAGSCIPNWDEINKMEE